MPSDRQRVPDSPSVVSCRVAGVKEPVAIDFGCQPDTAAAATWRQTFRRLSHVRVRYSDTGWSCTVHGTGHRLPVTRPVPLRVALGLAIGGTPIVATLGS